MHVASAYASEIANLKKDMAAGTEHYASLPAASFAMEPLWLPSVFSAAVTFMNRLINCKKQTLSCTESSHQDRQA